MGYRAPEVGELRNQRLAEDRRERQDEHDDGGRIEQVRNILQPEMEDQAADSDTGQHHAEHRREGIGRPAEDQRKLPGPDDLEDEGCTAGDRGCPVQGDRCEGGEVIRRNGRRRRLGLRQGLRAGQAARHDDRHGTDGQVEGGRKRVRGREADRWEEMEAGHVAPGRCSQGVGGVQPGGGTVNGR